MFENISLLNIQGVLDNLNAQHREQRESALKQFFENGFENISLNEIELAVLRKLNPSDGEFSTCSVDYDIIANSLSEKELVEGRGCIEADANGHIYKRPTEWRRNIFGDKYLEWRKTPLPAQESPVVTSPILKDQQPIRPGRKKKPMESLTEVIKTLPSFPDFEQENEHWVSAQTAADMTGVKLSSLNAMRSNANAEKIGLLGRDSSGRIFWKPEESSKKVFYCVKYLKVKQLSNH